MSERTLLVCGALILAAVAVTWWIYGFGPLVVALAVLALVCPAVGIWMMRESRRAERRREAAKKAPEVT
jgi:Flp pilus assembly protein TadB